MKGIVLAGGKGSRLRPFTYSGAKQLVPIGNTPVLEFPVRQMVEAGIVDIAIVVGDTEAQIRDAMGDGSRFGARFHYMRQEAPLGIAHGVKVCREFIDGDAFVLYLGDNVLQGGIREFVEAFKASGASGSVVLKAVDDPRAFGVAVLDGECLLGVVEKPADPPSNLAVIGVYAFSSAVFDVIDRQTPSARGELEIADSISGLLGAGCVVTARVTSEYWIDTGKMEDMLAANRAVLEDVSAGVHESAKCVSSDVQGAVAVGPNTVVEGCRVSGPSVVGANVQLRNCSVGPYVAIGDGCVLNDVTIENSIVMEQTTMELCVGVSDSMIGRFVVVRGAPAGARLTLGDHSRFEVVG